MAKLPSLNVGLVVLVLVVCLNAGCTKAVPAIRSKCSACRCIAQELKVRMEDEKPRNHLDMRHRLDEHGKRYGKVIDYKISELRAVELLDRICDTMSSFVHATFKISDSGKTTEAWGKSKALTNGTRWPPSEEATLQKQLNIYCGAVLEEWEEEIEAAITGGKFEDPDVIDEYLCTNMVKACPDGSVPNEWIDEPTPETANVDGPEAAPAPDAADPGKQEL